MGNLQMKRKWYDSKKRKLSDLYNIIVIYCKKQRTCKCIVHEEKYICDIYECNGNVNRDRFI